MELAITLKCGYHILNILYIFLLGTLGIFWRKETIHCLDDNTCCGFEFTVEGRNILVDLMLNMLVDIL